MITNRFYIGDRVWFVDYSANGFFLKKCLVVGMTAFLTDVSQVGMVEQCIQAVQYSLYPISKDPDGMGEFLRDEQDRIQASALRMFKEKEDAFHFMDTEIMSMRRELENE